MKKQFLLIAGLAVSAFFVLSTTHSLAQQTGEPAPGQPMRFEMSMQNPETAAPAGDFVFIGNELSFGGKLVKNAPYSATAITESIQTLSDGNRIVTRSTAALYRDSEGRTRREQSLGPIGAFAGGGEPQQMIFIDDPVAGVSYTLNARSRTAQKMPPMRFKFEYKVSAPAGEGVGGTTVTLPADQPGQFEIQRVEGRAKMAADGPRYVWGWRNQEAKTESLGRQNIEGIDAEGTRGKVTIPAGEIGNEREIEIIDERWYSPELQTIVMTRHSDPRFGESSYRLTNISRSEPAKSLFEVPSDYSVSSGSGSGSGQGGGTAAGGSGSGAGSGSGGAITGGVLNGKAISLPLPPYPPIAKAAHASGSVKVQVTIDEEGNVISAQAIAGHPLLQSAAVAAARQAKFSPTKLSGQLVKVRGVLVYTFSE